MNKKEYEKSIKLPPLGIINNIVFSKNSVWAYYILSDKPYDFLSASAKVDLANSTIKAISGLCQSADKKIDCHILISNQAFSPESWVTQIVKNYEELVEHKTLPFYNFVEQQMYGLYDGVYRKRITYLGVKLFDRGSFDFSKLNPLEFGFKEAFEVFKKSSANLFKFNYTEITDLEEHRARTAEQEIFRTLATSDLQVERPTSENLMLTIKRRLYPAMPMPFLETNHEERLGLSDIVIESSAVIEHKARFLKISQIFDEKEFEGYRATLSFSKFPKEGQMTVPSSFAPFLYKAVILPFTVNCRFSLIPTEAMKSDLNKKKMETEDEINNLIESGQRNNPNLKETLNKISTLENELHQENYPWITGSYRITVEADSEENLKTYISNIKNEYIKEDYILTWTTGDQLKLFREEFPGGNLEVSDFNQTTNIDILGVAGINCGDTVGDEVVHTVKYTRR